MGVDLRPDQERFGTRAAGATIRVVQAGANVGEPGEGGPGMRVVQRAWRLNEPLGRPAHGAVDVIFTLGDSGIPFLRCGGVHEAQCSRTPRPVSWCQGYSPDPDRCAAGRLGRRDLPRRAACRRSRALAGTLASFHMRLARRIDSPGRWANAGSYARVRSPALPFNGRDDRIAPASRQPRANTCRNAYMPWSERVSRHACRELADAQ
jgi:hypothetical protein